MVTTVNPLLCHSYYSTARDAADVGRGCATTVGQFDCPDCIGQDALCCWLWRVRVIATAT